jgi:acyl-CoA thioesterase-1
MANGLNRHASLLLATLLALCCGPADDAGNATSGSTGGAPSGAEGAAPRASGSAGGTASAPGAVHTARAVFIGTSLTAGFGLAEDAERFTDRLQRMADSAGIPILVVNAGLSGDTSAGGLRRLDWALRDGTDVLFIELGANDGLRGQSVTAMKANLDSMVVIARALVPDVRIVLAGMEVPPNLGPRYAAEFRNAFRDLASERDLILVPFLLEGVGGIPEMNQPDRIHPNVEGHQHIARLLWPVLEPLFKDAVGTPVPR